MPKFEVGQEVAIRRGYGYATYQLATVERVTPAGQVLTKTTDGQECRFGPSGKMHGGSSDSVRLVELTPAIREQARRKVLLDHIKAVKLDSLDTATLERVVAALG